MKKVLQLEELTMAALGIYFLSIYHLDLSIWIWVLLFFSPDISMIGYLVNTRVGAACYNIFHHKGVAIVCIAIAHFMDSEILLSMGILLFAHASFDRIFGYGLKYTSSFNDTHLGKLKNVGTSGSALDVK